MKHHTIDEPYEREAEALLQTIRKDKMIHLHSSSNVNKKKKKGTKSSTMNSSSNTRRTASSRSSNSTPSTRRRRSEKSKSPSTPKRMTSSCDYTPRNREYQQIYTTKDLLSPTSTTQQTMSTDYESYPPTSDDDDDGDDAIDDDDDDDSTTSSIIDYNKSYKLTGLSESDTTRSTSDMLLTETAAARNSSKAHNDKSFRDIHKMSGYTHFTVSTTSVGLDGTIHPKAATRGRIGGSRKLVFPSPLSNSEVSVPTSQTSTTIHTPTPCELYEKRHDLKNIVSDSGESSFSNDNNDSSRMEMGSKKTFYEGITNDLLSTRGTSTHNNIPSKDTLDQRMNQESATPTNKNGPKKSRSITPEKRGPTKKQLAVNKPLFRPPILTSVMNKKRLLTPEKRGVEQHQQQQRAATAVATNSPNPILKKKNNSRSTSPGATKQQFVQQPKPPSTRPPPPPDGHLSESQTFNYWQSHELGLVPGVEVSNDEIVNNTRNRPRNLLQQLHSLRASKERTKDEIILSQNENDVENQQQQRVPLLSKLGSVRPLPTLLEEQPTKNKKDHVSKITNLNKPNKSMKSNVSNKNNSNNNNISKQGQKHTMATTNMPNNQSSHNIDFKPSQHTKSSLYFILFLLSLICTLSLTTTTTVSSSSNNRTTTENATLAFLLISTIISFITCILLKLTKRTRSYLINGVSLDIPHVGLFEFKSIVSLLSIVLLICWGIVWRIVSFNNTHDDNELGLYEGGSSSSDEIWNANLYIGTWFSFGLVCWLFADGCVAPSSDDVTQPQPPQQQDRHKVQWQSFAAMEEQSRRLARIDIARSWMLNFIFSILLIAICGSTLHSPICGGGSGSILNGTTLCERLRLSIVFGVLGIVLTLVYCGIRFVKAFQLEQKSVVKSNHVSNYNLWLFWNTRVDQVSAVLSIICSTVYTLNAGFMTSSGSVGSNVGNVWLVSWACFGLSIYLTMKHVDIFWSKKTGLRRASVDKASNKNHFPVIHVHRRRSSCDTSAITDDETSASGTSYSVTCDEETGGTTSYTSSERSMEDYESDFTSTLPSIGPTFRTTCNSRDDETKGQVTPSSSSMQYSHLWQHHYQHALEEKKRPDPEMKPCPTSSKTQDPPSAQKMDLGSLGRNAKPRQPPARDTKQGVPTRQSKQKVTSDTKKNRSQTSAVSNQQPSRAKQKDPPATVAQPQRRHKSPLANTDQDMKMNKKSKPVLTTRQQNSQAVRPKQQKQTRFDDEECVKSAAEAFNEECLKSAAVLQREEDEIFENVKNGYRLESERERNWRRESLVADPVSILNALENDGVSLLQALRDHDRAPSKVNEMQRDQVISTEKDELTDSTLWIKTDGVSVVSSLPCESMIDEQPLEGKGVSQDISLFSTIEAAKRLKESTLTAPTLDVTNSLTTRNSSLTGDRKSTSTKESITVGSMTSASTFVGSIGPLTIVDSTASPESTVDSSLQEQPKSKESKGKESLPSDVSDLSPLSDLSEQIDQRLTSDQMVEAALAEAQFRLTADQGIMKINSPFVDNMVRDIVMNGKGELRRKQHSKAKDIPSRRIRSEEDSLSSGESTDLAFDC